MLPDLNVLDVHHVYPSSLHNCQACTANEYFELTVSHGIVDDIILFSKTIIQRAGRRCGDDPETALDRNTGMVVWRRSNHDGYATPNTGECGQ